MILIYKLSTKKNELINFYGFGLYWAGFTRIGPEPALVGEEDLANQVNPVHLVSVSESLALRRTVSPGALSFFLR